MSLLRSRRKPGKSLQLHREWLIQPNVLGISYGNRLVGDQLTGESVLIVHVRRKRPISPYAPLAIPRQIRFDGLGIVGVDVREQAVASAASARALSIRRRSSAAHGRVTTWVRRGRREYLLTCQHVVQAAGQPVDALLGSWTEIGRVALVATLVPDLSDVQREADQALVVPGDPGDVQGVGWPRYASVSSLPLARDSMLVVRHGRQAETRAWVLDPRVTERVTIGGSKYFFPDLIKTTLASIKGDSGCAVEDQRGNLVGYVIADTSHLASAADHFTLIQPIEPVLHSLGCSLPPSSGDPVYLARLSAAARAVEAGQSAGLPLAPDPRDVDVMARTLWGEARGHAPRVMDAFAHLIRNRLLTFDDARRDGRSRFGRDLATICLDRRQFRSWSDRAALESVDASDAQFRRAIETAHAALSGRLGLDPTDGATHQRVTRNGPGRRRSAGRPGLRVEGHEFFRQ